MKIKKQFKPGDKVKLPDGETGNIVSILLNGEIEIFAEKSKGQKWFYLYYEEIEPTDDK